MSQIYGTDLRQRAALTMPELDQEVRWPKSVSLQSIGVVKLRDGNEIHGAIRLTVQGRHEPFSAVLVDAKLSPHKFPLTPADVQEVADRFGLRVASAANGMDFVDAIGRAPDELFLTFGKELDNFRKNCADGVVCVGGIAILKEGCSYWICGIDTVRSGHRLLLVNY